MYEHVIAGFGVEITAECLFETKLYCDSNGQSHSNYLFDPMTGESLRKPIEGYDVASSTFKGNDVFFCVDKDRGSAYILHNYREIDAQTTNDYWNDFPRYTQEDIREFLCGLPADYRNCPYRLFLVRVKPKQES
jgi:hypothetical protein